VPAPAVIPAPIAYINAAAVKGFVVEYGVVSLSGFGCFSSQLRHRRGRCLAEVPFIVALMLLTEEVDIAHATHAWPPVVITVKKTACSRQPLAVE